MHALHLNWDILILSGYVLFGSCLNFVAMLISAFYQKRLNQPAPKLVFIISIALSFLFIISIIIESAGVAKLQIVSSMILIGSSCLSAVGILNLFLSMRKTRK